MTDTITLDQFIANNHLVLKVTDAPENPHMTDDEWKGDHFFYTLNTSRRHMSGYFSKGIGLREYSVAAARSARLVNVHKFKQGTRIPSRWVVADVSYKAAFVPVPPTLVEILDSLASDASGIEGARTFEEWAGEYGFDVDSRTALKIYKATKRQSEKLRALLGVAAYETLLYNTERL